MDQVGIGVVALSKTIITPVTQPCAMLMPMVDLVFAIQIHECVCFIGASSRVLAWLTICNAELSEFAICGATGAYSAL